MSIAIHVPVLPESVTNASVATWYKKPGDKLTRDEKLVDIETDKVILEVLAPQDGILEKIEKDTGATVVAQEVIGQMKAASISDKSDKSETSGKSQKSESAKTSTPTVSAPLSAPISTGASSPASAASAAHPLKSASIHSPSARRKQMAEESSAQESTMPLSNLQSNLQSISQSSISESNTKKSQVHHSDSTRAQDRVPMSRLRARIAQRLLEAQHQAAILTTFNEVNMQPIMDLRTRYKDIFEKKHGVKLGFMSFFTIAVIAALKKFPALNAYIDGNDIIYNEYYDIAIAVSTPRGLVVPVLRDAQNLSIAEIEKQIYTLGEKAREGHLTMEEMSGGTFTISNGGVFGSLLSTPILNTPQSGILGMHKIEERPVVEKGQIVIRPMMYLALSYDHRIVDGRESVQCLVAIKEMIEDPARWLLNI